MMFFFHSSENLNRASCSGHGQQRTVGSRIGGDVTEQIKIFTLPPNCTSVYQPMYIWVIAAFKLRYKRSLLERISGTIEERASLRCVSSKRKAGMKVFDEGYPKSFSTLPNWLKTLGMKFQSVQIARCLVQSLHSFN